MAPSSDREREICFEYAPDRRTLLLRGQGLSAATLVLAAAAAARLGHAYDWGHNREARAPQGLQRHDSGRPAPTPDAGETARAQAKRTCGIGGTEHDPVAFATVPGVPEGEMGPLAALTALCVQAAERLAGDTPPGELSVVCLSQACEDCSPTPDTPCFAAGLLAARLDIAHLLEFETQMCMVELLAALVAQRPDLRPWIPIEHDPTVRVREPEGHPGLPLIVTPFVMETESAWEAVERRGVVDDAFVAAAPAVEAVWRTLCVRA